MVAKYCRVVTRISKFSSEIAGWMLQVWDDCYSRQMRYHSVRVIIFSTLSSAAIVGSEVTRQDLLSRDWPDTPCCTQAPTLTRGLQKRKPTRHSCSVLNCTVLYCTVLYFTVLYFTVLYSTVQYCTVLYCTVLYCSPVLFCSEGLP